MIIERSLRFDRAYKKLPKNIQSQFKEKFLLLIESNLKHPSLRIKKINGTDGIWEASIDMNYRFTFEKIKDGIRLRVIGAHEVIEKP